MPTLNTLRLDPPLDSAEFEKMVNAAAQIRWRGTSFQRYGRPGQQQHGVDTYGQTGVGAGVAIQCKNTCHALPFSTVVSEVTNATHFPHPINFLFIATTQANDKLLQDDTWKLSARRGEQSLHPVSLLFWEDVVAELAKDWPTIVSFYPHLTLISNDDAVLHEVKRILPHKGSIEFVKEYKFCGATFNPRYLDDLYVFWNRCEDPSFAFNNQRLEALKLALIRNIRDFTGLIGAHYTRVAGQEVLAFHDYEDRTYIDNLQDQMEKAADVLVNTYRMLLTPLRT